MDTVNYEMVKQVNKELLSTQEQINRENSHIYKRNKEIVDRLEDLSNNANIKYLNFKVIGGALGIGLLLGALAMGGYTYYALKNNVKIKTVEVPVKTEVQIPVEKKVYVENPVNEDLQEQVEKLQSRVEELKSKVLPANYYCSLTSGKKGLCINRDDDRYIADVGDGDFFIELK